MVLLASWAPLANNCFCGKLWITFNGERALLVKMEPNIRQTRKLSYAPVDKCVDNLWKAVENYEY